MADAASMVGFGSALVGAAQGFERGQELAAKDEERKQQRELFRQQKKEKDLKLKEMYSPNAVKSRAQELEIQLKEQSVKLEGFEKQATRDALDKATMHHAQSGNWNSFNEAIKGPQGERVNKMIGGGGKVKNISGADLYSKEDRPVIAEMLNKMKPEQRKEVEKGVKDTNNDGIIDANEIIAQTDPTAFKKRFGRFVIDMPDGTTKVEFRDITTLWARTGYGEYLEEKERTKQLASIELNKKKADLAKTEKETELLGTAKPDSKEERRTAYLALKNKKSPLTPEETNTLNSYKKEFEEPESGNDLTTTQKEATAVAEAKARVKAGTASGADKELIAAWNKKTDMTDRATKAYMAKDERDEANTEILDKSGYDGTAEPTTEAGRDALRQLKKDYPLKGEPEKLAMKFGSLVDLGAKGSGLNEEQTGLISNLLTKAETYYSDSMDDGEAARSAYLQYQTGIKHLLYGSALTATEIESFNQAYGNLGLGTGAILSKFRTSLESLQKEAESAEKNPNVNKHVWNSAVGAEKRKLAETIHNIKVREEQLRMVKAKRSKADIDKYAEEHPFIPKLSPAEQKKQNDEKKLSAIFNK